ncbi:MAG: hypothetical protein JSU87_07585 [Gemmatimonadota bacterium]|nr:MAG: hypothetical protein JSU87_07585 [Gemmatimonadota bacterium]
MSEGARCVAWLAIPILWSVAAGQGGPQGQVRVGAVTLHYWPGQRAAAEALAAGLEQPVPMPGLPEDILAGGTITVYLAPDPQTFDSLAPGVPDWSGAIAFPEGDEIVLPVFSSRGGGVPLAVVLQHELAHVALSRYLGRRVPRWFHEGYAQLASGSWGSEDAWALRFAILLGKLPSLEAIDLEFREGRVRADHAYLLSHTAVEHLYRLGGKAGFARLLERWREVGELDLAMRRTYGLTQGQFERTWRREVGRRFGWLLVLTQTIVFWTMLTIILLVLGYWKKRRTRRKLVALEAAVAAAEADALANAALDRGADLADEGVIDGP